jgi:putative peptidoglycan lipid II flippase
MRQILKNGSRLLFRRQTNILSAATVIMITYAISYVIGLFKNRLLYSHFFGSQAGLLDSYNAAFLIPDTIFQIFVMGSISATFIPIFNKYFSKSESEAWKMANSVITLTLISITLFSALAFIFAHQLTPLIAPGFSSAQITTTANILRIALLAQLFFSVSGFLTSIIQSNQRFLIPALAPIVYNISIILGISFLSPSLGIFGPAFGVVIGSVLHMGIQIPLAWHLGFRFKPQFDYRHPGVREIAKLMPPRAVALGIDQIELFVAVNLASSLATGSVSLLNIARLLYNIPTTLFGITVGQAALPTLSQTVAKSDLEEFRNTLLSSIFQVLFVAIPTSVLFIVLRRPIVRIIFGSRSFPWDATEITSTIVGILAISAGFAAVMQLVVRGFYALHDTKTPLYLGLSFALFNTIVSLILVYWFNLDLVGIAISITATNIAEALALSGILYRRISPNQSLSYLFAPFLKIIFTSAVTGVVLWLAMQLLDRFVFDTTRTIPLVIETIFTTLSGFAIYLYLSHLLKIEQLASFTALGQRISSWRTILDTPPQETLVPSTPPDQT